MAESQVHILHLEDDGRDCELVEAMLNAEGIHCEIACVQTGEDFRREISRALPDLIISDYSMPSFDGLRALRYARENCESVPFIFFSGTLGEEAAVISLRDGATDYVLKQRPSRLVSAVRRALGEAEERRRREAAEEKLREHAALLDEARDAICLQDLDQRILFWNRSAERLYGWSAAEAIGRDANELLIQDAVALRACKELIGRDEWHGELQQTTRAGRSLIVESRWTLIRDATGQPKSILVINTDITEKKEMEAQYLRAQRVESIGMLAGGIAHDLNNILGPILMSAELLLETPGDPRVLLQGIATSAHRGTELVRQILAFARGADGEKELLGLRKVVDDATALFSSTFPKDIAIAVEIPDDLPNIFGNATQIHQVVLNLCVNARDAMPKGGRITIAAAAVTLDHRQTSLQRNPLNGPFIQLRVADTGTGIPADVLPRILDPFFSTKRAGKGTGLGLATVVGIVRGHGGSLDVTTEVGHGSTFTLYFPAATAEQSEGKRPGDAPSRPVSGRKWVLCVDDEAVALDTTRLALSRAGYHVLVAANGAEALAIFEQHQNEISLVLTDMMMPVMTGTELIVALRKLRPGIRIMAVSGTFADVKLPDQPGTAVQAMLHKPFNIATLLGTVRQVLSA